MVGKIDRAEPLKISSSAQLQKAKMRTGEPKLLKGRPKQGAAGSIAAVASRG